MGRLLVVLTFILSSIAYADLIFWTPKNQKAIYVLPEGSSPQAYLQKVKAHKDLSHFVSPMYFTPDDKVITVKADSLSKNERALLLANNQQDHSLIHIRLDNFGDNFPQTYALPIGAHLGLNAQEAEKFFSELGQHFGLLVPMGGDDVDPSLYSEKVTYSMNFNRTRDLLEAQVIRYFFVKTKNKIFGVCRGLQLTSVVLGLKLIQDNVAELHTSEEHKHGAFHDVIMRPTLHNTYANIMKKSGLKTVNSYHHQSVKSSSVQGTSLQIAATSPEGIVEALESRDNRVLLVQSHPEKEDNSAEFIRTFFTELKQWVGSPQTRSCKQAI